MSPSSSPLERWSLPSSFVGDTEVFIKRDDLLHPQYGGNKWRKLTSWFRHATNIPVRGVVTFGGPFSNHLYATASYANAQGIPSVGLVRTWAIDPDNPVLTHAKQVGMQLVSIGQEEYAHRSDPAYLADLRKRYPGYLVVPEGGAGVPALNGCADVVIEGREQLSCEPDAWFVASATGSTALGMSSVATSAVIAVAVLPKTLVWKDLSHFIEKHKIERLPDFTFDFHLGGLGKITPQLEEFVEEIMASTGVLLDPIYNAKAAFAMVQMLPRLDCRTCVFVHTGGAPGALGYNYLKTKAPSSHANRPPGLQ